MTTKFKLLFFLTLFSQMSGFSQSLFDLESELNDNPISDLMEVRSIADKILKIDKFNETGVKYYVESFRLFKDYNDSILVFFDNMVKSAPENPLPYILRTKYENYNFSLADTNKIMLLRKAYQLDEHNKEVNYLLGSLYYSLFIEMNIKSDIIEKQKYYAQKVKTYLTNLYQLDKQSIEKTKYPLIQVSNYLKDKTKAIEFENAQAVNNEVYFPIKLFVGFPVDWRTNYKYDIIQALEHASFVVNSYSRRMLAMKEPILSNTLLDKDIFRFSWFRSFHDPVTIRIERENGKTVLFWKSCNVNDKGKLGDLNVNKSKDLTDKEWNDFLMFVQIINFWETPTVEIKNGVFGVDGSHWILEGVQKNKYHVVDRWSPKETDYQKCCLYLLSLTELEITKKEIY